MVRVCNRKGIAIKTEKKKNDNPYSFLKLNFAKNYMGSRCVCVWLLVWTVFCKMRGDGDHRIHRHRLDDANHPVVALNRSYRFLHEMRQTYRDLFKKRSKMGAGPGNGSILEPFLKMAVARKSVK